MAGTPFIYETTNNRTERLIALSLLALIIIVGIFILVVNINTAQNIDATNSVNLHWYTKFVPDLVNNIDPVKLLWISFLGGMIFFPIPTELAFYFSIIQGYSPLACVIFATIGFVMGNIVNYFVGLKMSHHVLYLLSAKSFFKMRRQVNRWGVYAILLLNILPAPSDVLTVGLGTVRYNPRKLFFFSTIGNTIKFTIIAVGAHAIKGIFGW